MNFFKRKNKFNNLIKKRKKYFLLFSAIFVLLFISLSAYINPSIFGLFTKKAIGSDIDNLSGFAKVLDDGTESSWISFNCISDPYIGGQNIFTFTFPLYFSFPSCEESDYGVNIEEDGSFSGFALSDKYGYIDFAPAGSPQMPQYSSSTGLITGFAKIEDLGENGWLRLHEEVGQTYDAVSVDDYNGDLRGYAYNETIGWISFNCDNESVCGSSDYKVNYYRPLIAGDLSAPNWSITQACETRLHHKAVLRWDFTGDPQTAYQIIIDNDPVRDDDEPIYDTGKIVTEASQYICPNSGDSCELVYSSSDSYYWWIKLWDTHDVETDWVQFDTNLGHILTDNIDGNNDASSNPNLTFTTFKHAMPIVQFVWDPQEISLGDTINFDSAGSGSYYDNYYGGDYYNECDPVTNPCEYLWTVDGNAYVASSTNATTTINFNSLGYSDRVFLQIIDSDNYICSTSTGLLEVNLNLPDWRESSGSY